MAKTKTNIQDVGRAIIEQEFITCRFAKKFFKKNLITAKAPCLRQLCWRWKSEAQLAALAKKVRLPRERRRVKLTLHVGFSAEAAKPNVVLLGVLTSAANPNGPAGCFVVTFSRDKKKQNVAKISTVYLNRNYISGNGYADALLGFLQKEIYPVLKTAREELKADFVGRYVWAKAGFQFVEKYWFKDSGGKKGTMTLMEMAQRNFERFLLKHSVKVNQLKIVRDRKSVPIESIQELKTPADFAALVHRKGKKIKVAALKDENSFSKPEPMHVGKAFMLSSYLREGKTFIRSQGMVNFSVTALPYYNAYREVPQK